MADNGKTSSGASVALVTTGASASVIDPSSPLTRLNYFDGKLLRAHDLDLEQRYLRTIVTLSNQAGGAGIVHGYDTALSGGDTLSLGPGMAIDAQGRLLLLSQAATFSIARLIQQGQQLATGASGQPGMTGGAADFSECQPATAVPIVEGTGSSSDLYLVCLGHAEDYCGQEDVYGTVCEPACAKSSQRPYVVEGIVVLLRPLGLALEPLPKAAVAIGRAHLRSRAASSFFAREATETPSLISAAGLRSGIFCLGSDLPGGTCVPVAVLDRAGSVTTFIDPWIARRERIETPPRRYWAWRMAMRPLDVFLAQVAQFQCQLPGALGGGGGSDVADPVDPCANKTQVIGEVATAVKQARDYLAGVAERLRDVALSPELRKALALEEAGRWVSGYEALAKKVEDAQQPPPASDRLLIRGGILELPSAGYLPVAPTAALRIEEQVRRLLGEGVDLRFCVVRADYVAHALEEAQHMQRISLLDGLADPNNRPKVDILVPDGELAAAPAPAIGTAFDAVLTAGQARLERRVNATPLRSARGVARGEVLPGGGGAFYFAGVGATGRDDEEPPIGGQPTPANGPIGSGGVFVPGEINIVAEAARRRVMHRLAERPLPEDRPIETRIDGLPTKEVPAAASGAVFALWLSMRSEADPRTLNAGATTRCSGRIVSAVPSAKPTLSDMTFAGELVVRQRSAGAGNVEVQAILRGHLNERGTSAGATNRETINVNVPVTIIGGTSGTAGALAVKIPLAAASNKALNLVSSTKWGGVPTEATSTVTFTRDDPEGPPSSVERLQLREDPAVLRPGDQRRIWALQGLDVLDVVLDEPGFRASAEQALFPPPLSDQGQTLVRPRRDWVLFHRRRDSSCDGGATKPPPVVRNRIYRLYVASILKPELAAAVREALLKNDPAGLKRAQFTEVGLAETEGAGSGVVTPGNALLAALAGVPHGEGLYYSAIAAAGEAASDGEAVALGRLANVEALLSRALVPAAGRLPSEVLGIVPAPSLSASNADGIIAIVTGTLQTPVTRKARLIAFDANNRPLTLPGGTSPPDIVAPETNVAVTLATDDKETLQKLFPGAGRPPAAHLDLLLAEAQDAGADERLKTVLEALIKLKVANVDTTTSIRPATAAEQPLFTAHGTPVNELFALRARG